MKLARVFPRKTKASPDDALAFFGLPPFFVEADEVHVSVAFTADKAHAEQLAKAWKHIAPVKVGGVAYGDRGEDFVPGRYIKHGYTFTSRGCPRRCWFCSVWKRDPVVRPLPIQDGWNILDDNLLACPEPHVRAVFEMLARQGRRIAFTGGLEALSLQDYQVELLAALKPRPTCFFAYDPGDPFETLENAASRLLRAGFTRESHRLRCYVLIGFPKDTFDAATKRLESMVQIGFTPNGNALGTRNTERGKVSSISRLEDLPTPVGATRLNSSSTPSGIWIVRIGDFIERVAGSDPCFRLPVVDRARSGHRLLTNPIEGVQGCPIVTRRQQFAQSTVLTLSSSAAGTAQDGAQKLHLAALEGCDRAVAILWRSVAGHYDPRA